MLLWTAYICMCHIWHVSSDTFPKGHRFRKQVKVRTRTDSIRRNTQGIALAVGLFAGGDSYTHIYSLARQHQDIVSAALLPLAGDGVIIAASSAMLTAAQSGRAAPFKIRAWFWGGILATLTANGAYGYQHGITNAMLSLWAVVAYLGCTEILAWVHLHLGVHPKRSRVAPEQPAAYVPVRPEPDARDELQVHRDRRARQPLAELLALAEDRYPDVLTGKLPVPPLRAIQDAMSIGQPKAQQVQAHFRKAVQLA